MNNGIVRGRVTKLVGKNATSIRKKKKGIPLKGIPVYVLLGKFRPFANIKDRQPLTLILTAYTDHEGRFEFSVRPGQYTIVAEINGKLYLNNYIDNGFWWYVHIHENQVMTYDITDTSEVTP